MFVLSLPRIGPPGSQIRRRSSVIRLAGYSGPGDSLIQRRSPVLILGCGGLAFVFNRFEYLLHNSGVQLGNTVEWHRDPPPPLPSIRWLPLNAGV